MNNVESSSIKDALKHTRNSLMHDKYSEVLPTADEIEKKKILEDKKNELLKLKQNVKVALTSGNHVESCLYQYLRFLRENYFVKINESFVFGDFSIHGLYDDCFEVVYDSKQRNPNSVEISKSIFLNQDGDFQYDNMISQTMLFSKNINTMRYLFDKSYDKLEDMVQCHRVVSNVNGSLSDDVEIIVPRKYINQCDISLDVPDFDCNIVENEYSVIFRYHCDVSNDKKVVPISKFIGNSEFKLVEKNNDPSPVREFDYILSKQKINSVFDGDKSYGDFSLGCDKNILETIMQVKCVCDFFKKIREKKGNFHK